MTGRPEKIVIAPEDLRDPRVDAALAQQVSFGMGAPPAPVEDRRTGLIYRPWFALMLAGGLGAFLAWALIEPVFSDGIEFSGAVQSGALPTADGEFSTLGVAGVDVLVSRPFTIVQDDRPPEAAGSFDHTIAHVRGESIESGQFVAAEVHLTPGDAGDAPPPDLAAVGRRQTLVGLFVFPLIAALVGLFIGAADGVLSRARRRALLCGSVGLGLGLAVGLVAALLSTVLYWVGSTIAAGLDTAGPGGMSAGALVVQMMARGLAWAAAGIGMGLGQGIALRSPRLLVNGLVGGVVGGLLGGLLFDPIDYVVHGGSFGSGGAEVSRAVGFTVIGMCTGLMIGVVELLAREAWVKMLTGPLAGKEFVLYRNPTVFGSSPKADVYLFKDATVEATHALLHRVGEVYEIEDRATASGTFVNGRRVARRQLASGDQLRIGHTVLSFTVREA